MKEYKASYKLMTEISDRAETIEGYEGSLIDNILLYDPKTATYYFFKEIFQTVWTSVYYVYECKEDESGKIFDIYYNCQAEHEKIFETL